MVAYHNTERIFGFQYISLDEMDERIYGSVPGIGAKVFDKSVSLLEAVLEQATACYPDEVRLERAFDLRHLNQSIPCRPLNACSRPARLERRWTCLCALRSGLARARGR